MQFTRRVKIETEIRKKQIHEDRQGQVQSQLRSNADAASDKVADTEVSKD